MSGEKSRGVEGLDPRAGRAAQPPVANTHSGSAETVIQAGTITSLHVHLGSGEKPLIPHGLPSPRPSLVNRDQEMAALDDLLAASRDAPGAVVSVVTGMSGVGKTTASIYWAARQRQRFGDGDLFGDFSERHVSGGADVSEILAGFIRQLGTAPDAIPTSLSARTDLYRRLTASKQLLVVLDDVGEPAHVKPLVPTGPGSVVVVTSNSYLDELLYQGAQIVPLGPLDHENALRLLVAMAGSERISVNSLGVERLLAHCDGLPLALCICGATIKSRVQAPIEDMVDELERIGRTIGPAAHLNAVFDLAYQDLDAGAARLYRLLGLHPGPLFDPIQAAALAGIAPLTGEQQLAELADRHLVESSEGGYYRLHNTIAAHARTRANDEERPAERDAALRRLLEWYYAAVSLADRVLIPERLRLATPPPFAKLELPRFNASSDAMAWFDRERVNIMAGLKTAVDRGWDDLVWPIVEGLWLYFYNRKPIIDWIEATRLAIASARRLGDKAVEARMHAQLARAYLDEGDLPNADMSLSAAEHLAPADPPGLRASLHEFRGLWAVANGEVASALEEFETARATFASLGWVRGAALQDQFIGRCLTLSGEPSAAIEPLEQVVQTMRASDDQINTARALIDLGRAIHAVGDPAAAHGALNEALVIGQALGIAEIEAAAHEELERIHRSQDRADLADHHQREAAAAYERLGLPS